MVKTEKKRKHDGAFIQVQTKNAKASKDMARPSVLVRLDDPEFATKFTKLFEEHVEGFTGLRGVKRELTEKDKQMEWRVRLKAKQQNKTATSKKRKEATNKKDTVSIARQDAILKYRDLKKKQQASSSSKGVKKARIIF